MSNFEQRALGTVEARDRKLSGHAALYNVRTRLAPGIFEEIAPGAFAAAIAEDDVRLTVDHNPSKLLARTASGTLHLSDDGKGLAVAADFPDTQLARDVSALMDRGDLTQMSFRFLSPPEDTWTQLPDGSELRTLTGLRLLDVSLVTYPAYPDAKAALRSRPTGATVPADIRRRHALWAMRHERS